MGDWSELFNSKIGSVKTYSVHDLKKSPKYINYTAGVEPEKIVSDGNVFYCLFEMGDEGNYQIFRFFNFSGSWAVSIDHSGDLMTCLEFFMDRIDFN